MQWIYAEWKSKVRSDCEVSPTLNGRYNLVERLEIAGYAIVPMLDHQALESAREWSGRLDLPELGFGASHVHLEAVTRGSIDQAVHEFLAGGVADLMPGWRQVTSAVIWKSAATNRLTPPHQDLTYTDEREDRSYVVWVPLIDTSQANGGMTVVPGSHRWTVGVRSGGRHPSPLWPHQKRLEEMSIPVAVPAGAGLVWDSALIHGSSGNSGAAERIAMATSLIPAKLPIRYFHRYPSGETVGYLIDEDHFMAAEPFFEAPVGYLSFAPWAAHVEASDFEDHVK